MLCPAENTTHKQTKSQTGWLTAAHSSLMYPPRPSPRACLTSVQASEILKEMKRRNTRRNICFLSCQISLNSCAEFEPMTGSTNQIMCETDAEATRSCSLQTLFVSKKALISHFVMFFLEHGYFSGTVISAAPHQEPFWLPPSCQKC